MTVRGCKKCACGQSGYGYDGTGYVSVMMQVSRLGVTPRVRAKAVTIVMCDECAHTLHLAAGRPSRKRLTLQVMKAAASILPAKRGLKHAA